MTLPAALATLRDEAMLTSCEAWALQKGWQLSRGIDRAGPCPVCGGTDRFAIHIRKNTFLCRQCGISGVGVIDLVMRTEGVEFVPACEIVTGRKAEIERDPGEAARFAAQADAEQNKRAVEAERYREAARKAAYGLWNSGFEVWWAGGGAVSAQYLRLRGIDWPMMEPPSPGVRLREIGLHPWKEKRGDTWVTLHQGPAMVAAVQRRDGTFGAVHVTWLDLAQPKGKLVLPADGPSGERPSKKVLGAKKGGAIRLFTPAYAAKRIVMGEGIETTLTACAHAFEFDTAYWAGVDLGNMAGRAARSASGGQLWDQPDLDDTDCFLPPDWCEELIYLCDGDEASNHTEEKVIRGLRRALTIRERDRAEEARLPALSVSYVPPLGEGRDLNDLVRVGA